MAGSTRTKKASTVEEKIEEEFNLDKKVTVKNIANWTVGFQRKSEAFGDVVIAPRGSQRLTRNEIMAQVQSGNRLFTGIDSVGSHATIYVDDTRTRIELGFDSADGSVQQNVYSTEKLVKIFEMNQKDFQEEIVKLVPTRAEKNSVMKDIYDLKLNDYAKIKFAERVCGIRLEAMEPID